MAQPFPTIPLSGGFAPIQMECDVHNLVVVGRCAARVAWYFYQWAESAICATRFLSLVCR